MRRHSHSLAFIAAFMTLLALSSCTHTDNDVGSVRRDSGVGGQISQSGGATTTTGGAGGHSSGTSGGSTTLDGNLGGSDGTSTGGAGGTSGTGGSLTVGSGGNGAGGAGGDDALDAPAAGDTPGRTGGAGGSSTGQGGAGGSSTGEGGSTATGGAEGSAEQTCTYNGKTYPNGVIWPSPDGCWECWCMGSIGVCEAGPPCDAGAQIGPPCTYDGKSYPSGATFPSTDGCNICECLWLWTPGAACTLRDCSGSPIVDALPPIDATAEACVYNGKTYPLDVHFKAADGCNACHCRTDGQVTCTFQDCKQDAGAPDEGSDAPTGFF